MSRVPTAAALALAGALLTTGCGADPLTIRGSILLIGGPMGWTGKAGDPCQTGGSYADIQPGATVTVSDASGKTLALGALGDGTQDGASNCKVPFTVTGVPAGEKFYGVEVTHRGRLQYTAEQLAEPLALTLGN